MRRVLSLLLGLGAACLGSVRADEYHSLAGLLDDVTGAMVQTEPVVDSNGYLYVGTSVGAANGWGALLRLNTASGAWSVIHDFSPEEGFPMGQLLLTSNCVYGCAAGGGSSGAGSVWRCSVDGTGFTSFDLGDTPYAYTEFAGPVLGSGGWLYLTATQYTTSTNSATGAVWRLRTDFSRYETLYACDPAYGDSPVWGLTLDGNDVIYVSMYRSGLDLPYAGQVLKLAPPAYAPQVLVGPPTPGWGNPGGPLLLSGGFLYGTTLNTGGNCGVFRVSTNGGDYRLLHQLSPAEGTDSEYGLTEGDDGLLYGVTLSGGETNAGTLYRLARDGSNFSVVYTFGLEPGQGSEPTCRLVQDRAGNWYGATSSGDLYNSGAVFRFFLGERGVRLGNPVLGRSAITLPCIRTIPGQTYAVQYTRDPGNTNWTDMMAFTAGQEQQQPLTLPFVPTGDACFFRVKRTGGW